VVVERALLLLLVALGVMLEAAPLLVRTPHCMQRQPLRRCGGDVRRRLGGAGVDGRGGGVERAGVSILTTKAQCKTLFFPLRRVESEK
jgi:hypothetical protein